MFHGRIDPHETVDLPGKEARRALADFLRENPGSIVLLAAVPVERRGTISMWAGRVQRAEGGMGMFAPAGSFEARGCTVFGLTRLFVRYTGEASSSTQDTPIGYAAAVENIRLVKAWCNQALFTEERRQNPDQALIEELTRVRATCMRNQVELIDADTQTIDKVGRMYAERFRQLTSEERLIT